MPGYTTVNKGQLEIYNQHYVYSKSNKITCRQIKKNTMFDEILA
jgi:hypothetical protein